MHFVSDVATSQVGPTIPKQDRRTRKKMKERWFHPIGFLMDKCSEGIWFIVWTQLIQMQLLCKPCTRRRGNQLDCNLNLLALPLGWRTNDFSLSVTVSPNRYLLYLSTQPTLQIWEITFLPQLLHTVHTLAFVMRTCSDVTTGLPILQMPVQPPWKKHQATFNGDRIRITTW